jgi:dipeptidase D
MLDSSAFSIHNNFIETSMLRKFLPLTSLLLAMAPMVQAAPSQVAIDTAQYALTTYRTQVVDSLAHMVSYNTVADPKQAFETNPQFVGFKSFLKQEAVRLGFEYEDFGYVVRISYGQGDERVGVITHGDVQPVDPSKWAKSPFELDRTSEPGRLLARGSEDDKGPIATALYAMKAIKDQGVPLKKRIELYVYLAEESDWEHLEAFLKDHTPPQMNITLDSEYPAVTAEKGWGLIALTVPQLAAPSAGKPAVSDFGGGFFASQIPEDAHAVLGHVDARLEQRIRARAAAQKGMHYTFTRDGAELKIIAHGVSAHSSKPEAGINAISMLADALAVTRWQENTAGALVNLLNDLVGTGYKGEKFGKIAYSDSFMGPMTVAPTVIQNQNGTSQLVINVRRPQGKDGAQLKGEVETALAAWQKSHIKLAEVKIDLHEPWLQKDAPQLDTLLGVFSHFTGARHAKAVAIGGGTNSRLFPHAVSFGPTMPGKVYTGHSEHEFITEDQLLLNLQMYSAVLVELAR